MNVFELIAVLSIDTSGFTSGLSSAGKSALQFGAVAGNAALAVGSAVLDGLGQATDMAVEFGKQSVETGMTFDTSMSQVAATMGMTVEQLNATEEQLASMSEEERNAAKTAQTEFGKLRDFAQEMGRTTAFSASQSADALNYMALAGYDAETSMSMLPNVLNLAAAGSMDLARASDMVTDTQTAFGMNLERTSQMVDEMAKAASTGNTSVSQLGDAFLVVGGLAQDLNGGIVTLDDGTTATVDGIQELEIALTAMANAGVKGSEAGTHMRNMLLKLSSPTKEGQETFDALGVSVFNAEGDMRSLADIFGDLSVAFEDLTQEEKLQAISDIFNTRDVASAEALLEAVGQDWDSIGASILEADGAAGAMAETQLGNLAGDITIFKHALEGLQIAFSDGLSPALRDFVQFGTGGIRSITEGFKEDGLAGAVSNAIDYLVDNLPDLLEKVATEAVEVMDKIYDKLPAIINDGLPKLGEFAKNMITKFIEFCIEYADELPEQMQNAIDFYSEFLPMIIDLATQLISGLAETMGDSYSIIYPASMELMKILVNAILQNLPELVDAALKIMLGFTEGLISSLPYIISAVVKIGVQLVASVIELGGVLIADAIEIITSLLETVVMTALEFLKGSYWKDMLDSIVNSFTSIDWKELGSNIIKGITEGIKSKFETVKNAVKDVADGIKNKFKDVFDIHSPSKLFKYYGEMMMEGLDIGIEDNMDGITDNIDVLNDNIAGSMSNMSTDNVTNSSSDLVSALIRALREVAPEFAPTVLVDGNVDGIVDVMIKANNKSIDSTGRGVLA